MLNLGAVLEASLQQAAVEGTDESFTLVDTKGTGGGRDEHGGKIHITALYLILSGILFQLIFICPYIPF